MDISEEALPDEALPHKGKPLLQILGPGLITGASDDDPSGIGTYSQVGAQFGYGLGWAMLFSYPLMAAIQEISARVGRVTGRGLAGNMRRHTPAVVLYPVILLLLAANVINIGADLGAMAASIQLLTGGPHWLWLLSFGTVSAAVQVFSAYDRYIKLLKWLTLSLLAYVATALVVDVPWSRVVSGLLVPRWHAGAGYLTSLVAVLGTTISPYLFFWQSQLEVEDTEAAPEAKPLRQAPRQAPQEMRRIRIDTYLGMGVSNAVALFIIVTAAATLNAHGITDIGSAAEAAQALRPIAGNLAEAVFALGIIGTGLMAIPVLAGSAAYAVGEMRRWPVGLSRRPREAKAFYATVTLATLVGMAMDLLPVNPIRALFWSAVINGVVAVPVMVVMLWLARSPKVMGRFMLPMGLTVVGWLAAMVMMAAVGVMLFVG
jgi:NRAMP (natural resistance-associated macrophage protein)-like metal ion transporter